MTMIHYVMLQGLLGPILLTWFTWAYVLMNKDIKKHYLLVWRTVYASTSVLEIMRYQRMRGIRTKVSLKRAYYHFSIYLIIPTWYKVSPDKIKKHHLYQDVVFNLFWLDSVDDVTIDRTMYHWTVRLLRKHVKSGIPLFIYLFYSRWQDTCKCHLSVGKQFEHAKAFLDCLKLNSSRQAYMLMVKFMCDSCGMHRFLTRTATSYYNYIFNESHDSM